MEIFITWLAFLGDWLLFVFPLFQGVLDVTDGAEMLTKVKTKKSYHRKQISNLLWIIPPLKIMLERKKMNQIAKYALEKNVDWDLIYRKMNISTAWVYVSFAGLLNGIVVTEELLEKYGLGDNWWALIIVTTIIVTIGVHIVIYFTDPKRKDKLYNQIKK